MSVYMPSICDCGICLARHACIQAAAKGRPRDLSHLCITMQFRWASKGCMSSGVMKRWCVGSADKASRICGCAYIGPRALQEG